MWVLSLAFAVAPWEPKLVTLHFDGKDYRGLGHALGAATADRVAARFAQWKDWEALAVAPLATAEGKALYDAFLEVHTAAFPDYVEEMRGLADGARVPFEWVFLASVWLEWTSLRRPHEGVSHCSDAMLCSADACALAHNEDNADFNINKTVLVDLQRTDVPWRLQSLAYAGEFFTSGVFLTSQGIGNTQNWVGAPARAVGLGRNYMGRALADMKSVDDAVRILRHPNQTQGHSYNFADFCGRTITNVEVAGPLLSARRVEGFFFHANQYETLQVPNQTIPDSSPPRIARAAEMSPTDAAGLRAVIGDQKNTQWPIFHDELSHARGELSDWTIASVEFDIDAKRARVLQGNPAEGQTYHEWDLAGLACAAPVLV